ncbi:hypothetical protein ACFP3Q_14435 [Nocardioides sp. GCM10027113]|uniref:hypothetical protein n=1 Tax=unclassified Nocardioides TaxID=2615069 RepID=UPI00360C5410
MVIGDLPDDVRASFLAAYELEYYAAWRLAFIHDEAEVAAAEVPVPEAFLDAVRLRGAMNAVYCADASELDDRRAAYDEQAAALNEKYGDIVVLSVEGPPLGLRAHRRASVDDCVTDGVVPAP